VESLSRSVPSHRVFRDPAAQLTDDMQKGMGDLCCHESVTTAPLPPLGVFSKREAMPYPASALASPNFPTEAVLQEDVQ
jgi:hypothetical protein